jgi:hypothetical protein
MIRIYAASGLKIRPFTCVHARLRAFTCVHVRGVKAPLGRDSRQQSTPESAASTSLRQTLSRTVMTPISVDESESHLKNYKNDI